MMEVIETIIRVKVLPRASKDQIVGQENGVFKVKLTAPPVEGRANKALNAFLAKRLGLPKGSVEIVSGKRSRLKSVRIDGLTGEAVKALLNADA